MRRNGVELLTVINPGSSRRAESPWWRGSGQLGYSRDGNQLIGEALTKGEARKLSEWWNENFQPRGLHVHHFLRLNEVYSRGGKKRYDVVREVVQKNPDQHEWTKDRLKWFLGVGLVSSIAYGLYRDRTRQAMTGEEMRRASAQYWGLGLLGALGLYLLFGDKIKEMVPRHLQRNRGLHRDDVEWVEDPGAKLPRWVGYVDDEMVAEITVYKNEDGYRFRLVDDWAFTPADTFEEAVDGVLGDLRLVELEEMELASNPAERYFVRLPEEGVSYPKAGSEYYPKGYTLRKAQDFARIGSQTGGPREVRRGRRGGPKVRTYTEGKRTWPMTKGQARNLLRAETPKRLRAS